MGQGADGVLSIRQLQMQQVMQDLLAATGSTAGSTSSGTPKVKEDEALQAVLQRHADVVMAPFRANDDFIDDDPDSIYKAMNNNNNNHSQPLHEQRWHLYQNTVQQRIDGARNPTVRHVLQQTLLFVETTMKQEAAQQELW